MIFSFFIVLGLWCAVLGYWFFDYKRLKHQRESISIRIGVTGTRGKSTLVRLLAGAFRANGFCTAAKTSGSAPRFIFPDGSEQQIARGPNVSILEQRRIVGGASSLGADVLISEIMSIHPSNQKVESKDILDLTHVVITNCRIDHPEHGDTKESVAACFSNSIPEKGIIFCPENEVYPVFKEYAEALGAELVVSPMDVSNAKGFEEGMDHSELAVNIGLAMTVCKSFGLSEKESLAGMMSAVGDAGALRAWKWGGRVLCVNAFAANDVESTRIILNRLPDGKKIGLLNFREDRPERTLQFIEAIRNGAFNDIEMFFSIGSHGRFLKRKAKGLQPVVVLDGKFGVSDIMEVICRQMGDVGFYLIGMGNIAGKAMEIIGLWESEGEIYGL